MCRWVETWMGFILCIVVVGVLILRPGELISGLAKVPVYEGLMLTALTGSAGRIARALSPRALKVSPVTPCVLGFLCSIFISLIGRYGLREATSATLDFGKIVLLYLLIVANVTTARRLRTFLGWVTIFLGGQTALALAHYYDLIAIDALKAYAESFEDPVLGRVMLARLRAAGIFNDPNDFCVVLGMGLILSLHGLLSRDRGPTRWAW